MPTSKPADPVHPILITMGDPAGIGPEVAAEAFRSLGGRIGGRALQFVGDPEVLQSCGTFPEDAILPTRARAARRPGNPDSASADAVVEAIEIAVALAMKGEAAAVVTAPISKAVLMETGFPHPGHTDFLAELTGAKRAVMMLAGPALRVVPLTVHIPLIDVAPRLDTASIVETGEIVLTALKRDFGIAGPRLAIAGLNPHAGENGLIGKEEQTIIAPAAAALRQRGHVVLGPLPADTLFHEEARTRYDAALCMYHDQALIPLKTLAFWEGVNVTLGLPIVRTSPDHGTGFDIAGRGIADARSMIAAIELAALMADARAA